MMICESLKPMANFYNRKDSNVAIVKIINERNKTTTFNRNNKCLKILSIAIIIKSKMRLLFMQTHGYCAVCSSSSSTVIVHR